MPQMGQAELAMIDQLVNKHARAPPIPYLALWSRDSFKECATACPLTPTGGTRRPNEKEIVMDHRTAVPQIPRPRSRKNYRLDVLLFMTLMLLLLLFLGFSVGAR